MKDREDGRVGHKASGGLLEVQNNQCVRLVR